MEASRLWYRIHLMEAAVVGEEAELNLECSSTNGRLGVWLGGEIRQKLTYSGAD